MSGTSAVTTLIVQKVRDALHNDLVSVSEVRQIIADTVAAKAQGDDLLAQALPHFLAEDIEIGYARTAGGHCVKFIAWKGSIAERCRRAWHELESCGDSDKGFVFWLCLRANVDEYEMP